MTEPGVKNAFLRRLIYGTNTTVALIAGIGITAMVLITAMEVFKRYFLNMPTSWVLEISGYLMIFGAFLGMAYAMQLGAHVAVDIIYRLYPERIQRIADLTVGVLSLIFWVILTWKALPQALLYLERNIRSETVLAFPQFYPMMLVVVGSLMCCFQALLMTYDAGASLRDRDFSGSSDEMKRSEK